VAAAGNRPAPPAGHDRRTGRRPNDVRDLGLAARAAEARRVIVDCDQRLARYRAALQAGTDPNLVAQWTTEVSTTRAAAQAHLRDAAGAKPSRMTPTRSPP
jgi:hypothetical protein